MAIYHLTVKAYSRKDGHSSTAAAAYRAGVCIEDALTGETHDYTKRHGVAFTLMSFQESVRMDEILRYLQGDKPEKLEFDEMGVLRHADGSAFFENV